MTQTQDTQTLPARQQTENGTPLAKRQPLEEREVTYVPFQGTDKLTLTAGMVVKFLCKPTKRGFTCSAEHAVRFMMLCKARALNPWEGDAFLVGYDGQDGPEFNLITAHQAFLKRAEAHPEFEGMESGVMLMDGDNVITESPGDFIPPGFTLVGGWAKVYRKDRKIPCYRRANLATFNKGYSQWKSNPQGMICKVLEADALRSSFPNSLAGMFAEEEVGSHQVSSTVSDAPQGSKTEQLLKKVTSRPVSEGQTLEPTPEAMAAAEADRIERERCGRTEQEARHEMRGGKDANAKDQVLGAGSSVAAPNGPADAQDSAGSPADAAGSGSNEVHDSSGNADDPPGEAKGPTQVHEPADLTSHANFMTAMNGAAQDLGVNETSMKNWLAKACPDATDPKKRDRVPTGTRLKTFHAFVGENGGVVVD